MKKIFIFLIIIFMCTNCRKNDPKLINFGNIKYCFLDKPGNGLVYIEGFKKYSENDILAFSYCLAQLYNINLIKIESDIYYNTAIWSGKKKGITLYIIKMKTEDVSNSGMEVILENRIVSVRKSDDGINFVEIEDYDRRFDCLK